MDTADQAAPSGAASASNGGLPRLGSESAKDPKTEEVAIPDRGASVLLKKPSVETMLAMQELDFDEDNASKSFEASVTLIAKMLVEPDWGEDQLREEVKSWSMTDWLALQTAALKLSGTGEEIVRAAQESFRGQED